MIKRTRLHFFIVMAAVVFLIISFFCTGILLSTRWRNAAAADGALDKIIEDFETGRIFPDNLFSERFNNMRGFAVKMNSDFRIIQIKNNSFFTEEEIWDYINEIIQMNKTEGRVGNLEFRVKISKAEIIMAGLDTSMENEIFKELLSTVLLAGVSGTLVLLTILWFLSYWAVKPAVSALEKQKRFISEAGHELKTPLTVISAGAELLEKSGNPQDREKWIKSIKEQTAKMSVMTAGLLTLSKIDEKNGAMKTKFDLSQTVLTEALAFESVAYECGKALICDTEANLFCKGDCQSVRQAIGILCDNAIKHSDSGDTIKILLKKQGGKTILSVSNGGSKVKEEELPLLFERFYRGTESRAETEGTGLGLSILKTLAEKNGWTVGVAADGGKITFRVVF